MQLLELEPQFIRWVAPGSWQYVEVMPEASGVMFLCPRCFATNSGPIGTHMIVIWFRDRGVPDDEFPKPGRWVPSGSGYADLSLSPSINLPGPGGCLWHGYVTGGSIVHC
jgi:hypothetical protein